MQDVIKFGVLGFSYSGFDNFARAIGTKGYYTSNLGDNAQTIAGRQALIRAGIDEADVVVVDRDTLPAYSGPRVALLMNGVFHPASLPAPGSVIPIFLGFNADQNTIALHADWLRQHQPLGCRDPHTAELCRQHGIEAFVSGCVTATLAPRQTAPQAGRFFIVLGSVEQMPSILYKHIPAHLMDRAEFIQHRRVEGAVPLTLEMRRLNEMYEQDLIRRYREEAALVLTPLLHVASPCAAMKVPVIICRHVYDNRFGHIRSFMPVHTPEQYESINWNPEPVDFSMIAKAYMDLLKERISHLLF